LTETINSVKERVSGLKKIGVALPGLVDRQSKRVALSKHSPEHETLDLIAEISQRTGLEAVLENDANSAAFAEHRLGAGRGSANMFYVTLGKGVGGALILNDELWRGVAGFAGEFGQLAINSEGLRVEDMVSEANIARRTRARLHQDHTTSLTGMEESGFTVADIIAAAKSGDDFAAMMLERTGMFAGTGVAGVINLLNIEKIVIGGDVAEAGEPLMKGIIERAQELSFAPSFAVTEIVIGELGRFAGAIGAALISAD
jgi:glucokinase